MAVETRFKSYDRDAEFELKRLSAGEAHGWIDKSSLVARYILVRCLDSDYGFTVHMASEYDSENNEGVAITEENMILVVPAGFSAGIDIVDYEDESGRLSFQHVMPNGHIHSPN